MRSLWKATSRIVGRNRPRTSYISTMLLSPRSILGRPDPSRSQPTRNRRIRLPEVRLRWRGNERSSKFQSQDARAQLSGPTRGHPPPLTTSSNLLKNPESRLSRRAPEVEMTFAHTRPAMVYAHLGTGHAQIVGGIAARSTRVFDEVAGLKARHARCFCAQRRNSSVASISTPAEPLNLPDPFGALSGVHHSKKPLCFNTRSSIGTRS